MSNVDHIFDQDKFGLWFEWLLSKRDIREEEEARECKRREGKEKKDAGRCEGENVIDCLALDSSSNSSELRGDRQNENIERWYAAKTDIIQEKESMK